MAISDNQCIQFLGDDNVLIRSASLELLSSSYSTSQQWCQVIFETWDRFGAHNGFPDFPLLTHIEIPAESTAECVARAREMVAGKSLTDKSCRCAGKLIEAISVSSPVHFVQSMESLRELKQTSKIFFRVDIERMQHRADLAEREPAIDPILFWFQQSDAPELPYGMYPHLEAGFLRGQADDAIRLGFDEIKKDHPKAFVLEVCFELATRYRLLGYESYFADGLDNENTSIADSCAIALSRCRNDEVLSLIAERFADYSRTGQLRSIDVLRRSRLPKTPELLRFLRAHAIGTQVQNALRVAEVLQFDFLGLEDWLEALMVIDDASLERVRPLVSLAGPLSLSLPEEDRARALHLIKTRVK